MTNQEMIDELRSLLDEDEIEVEYCPFCIKEDYAHGDAVQIGMDLNDEEFCSRCFIMNLSENSDGQDLSEHQEDALSSLWERHCN